MPLLLGGVRSALLQVIATVTIAAYVNLGGLGWPIIQGIPLRRFDQKQPRRSGSVGGGEQQQPVGFQMPRQFGNERGGVGDMLDNFHRCDDVELTQTLHGQFASAIVDRKS